MLEYDRRRAFSFLWICPLFLMGTAFVTGSDLIAEVLEQTEGLNAGWTLEFVIKTLQHEGMQFTLPIFAVLPFSAGFVEEWKSGMIKNVIGRVRKKDYLCSKAVTAACAGGATLVMGVLLLLGVSWFLFGRLEREALEQEALRELLRRYMELLLRYFLNGALWAETGLLMSAWLNHRLMAWLSPFMIYYLLIIFYERYFSWCHIMYPREWIAARQEWPLEQWSLCLWLLFLTVMTGYLFYRTGERSLQNV